MWFVYILTCADNTFYTGVTKDLQRREQEHNTDNKKGAKYTRIRRPVHMIYSSQWKNKSDAMKEEWRIKKLSRDMKKKLIQTTL